MADADDLYDFSFLEKDEKKEKEERQKRTEETERRKESGRRRAERISELDAINRRLMVENAALQNNLAQLVKTARAEINRKDARITELRSQIDKLIFKKICQNGTREEFKELIDQLRRGDREDKAGSSQLEIPGGLGTMPAEARVVTSSLKVVDANQVQSVTLGNMSMSVVTEGEHLHRDRVLRLEAAKRKAASKEDRLRAKRRKLEVASGAKNVFEVVHSGVKAISQRAGTAAENVGNSKELSQDAHAKVERKGKEVPASKSLSDERERASPNQIKENTAPVDQNNRNDRAFDKARKEYRKSPERNDRRSRRDGHSRSDRQRRRSSRSRERRRSGDRERRERSRRDRSREDSTKRPSGRESDSKTKVQRHSAEENKAVKGRETSSAEQKTVRPHVSKSADADTKAAKTIDRPIKEKSAYGSEAQPRNKTQSKQVKEQVENSGSSQKLAKSSAPSESTAKIERVEKERKRQELSNGAKHAEDSKTSVEKEEGELEEGEIMDDSENAGVESEDNELKKQGESSRKRNRRPSERDYDRKSSQFSCPTQKNSRGGDDDRRGDHRRHDRSSREKPSTTAEGARRSKESQDSRTVSKESKSATLKSDEGRKMPLIEAASEGRRPDSSSTSQHGSRSRRGSNTQPENNSRKQDVRVPLLESSNDQHENSLTKLVAGATAGGQLSKVSKKPLPDQNETQNKPVTVSKDVEEVNIRLDSIEEANHGFEDAGEEPFIGQFVEPMVVSELDSSELDSLLAAKQQKYNELEKVEKELKYNLTTAPGDPSEKCLPLRRSPRKPIPKLVVPKRLLTKSFNATSISPIKSPAKPTAARRSPRKKVPSETVAPPKKTPRKTPTREVNSESENTLGQKVIKTPQRTTRSVSQSANGISSSPSNDKVSDGPCDATLPQNISLDNGGPWTANSTPIVPNAQDSLVTTPASQVLSSLSSPPVDCSSTAGISQILKSSLLQGGYVSPGSGMIRTPEVGHANYSPNVHLRSSYVRILFSLFDYGNHGMLICRTRHAFARNHSTAAGSRHSRVGEGPLD